MLSIKNQHTKQIFSLHETRSRYTRDTYTPHYFVGLFKRPDSSTLPLPVDARCPAAVLHLLFQPHIHASVHLQAQGLRVFSSSFTVTSRLMCCGESGVRSPYSKHVTCICCSNKHFDLELPDWNSLTRRQELSQKETRPWVIDLVQIDGSHWFLVFRESLEQGDLLDHLAHL